MLLPGALIVGLACGVLFMAQGKPESRELIAVELERSGGQVPTFHPKFRVDVQKLSKKDLSELERLVTKSAFFRQPARTPVAPHPDTFEYRLTVQANDASHTITYRDDDGHSESIDAMAEWIRTHQSQ